MDQDIFGLSKRTVIDGYELEIWEDNTTFYLQGPEGIQDHWGILEGTVGKIGWNRDRILVWQNECGQGEGWRVISTEDNTLSKIIPEAQVKADKTLKGIAVYNSKDAWRKLK